MEIIQCKYGATQLRTNNNAAANKGFAIAGLPFFADTFVQGGSSVSLLGVECRAAKQQSTLRRSYTAVSRLLFFCICSLVPTAQFPNYQITNYQIAELSNCLIASLSNCRIN